MTEFTFKFILLGDSGVGKSQISLRFCKNQFKSEYTKTEGLEYSKRSFPFNSLRVKSQVWDCGGSNISNGSNEKMTKVYYKNCVACVLVYDVTNKASYDSIESTWLKQLKAYAKEEILCLLVANKCDHNESQSLVNRADGERLAGKCSVCVV